ncbi:hypothetical protein [Cytobacillus oceanisediminis]|uniref:hypothetical protein n=1 Tax=Cytobacillus oceanisediminis TaxID=665099 RepID=UPI0037366CAB
MIDRPMIEQIVAEVVKRLVDADSPPSRKPKHNLLVVGETASLDPDLLKKMNAQWNIIHFETLEEAELHTVMKVVFLEASQDLIVKGALGICDTLESDLLGACILEYVPVTLIPRGYLFNILSGDKKNANQEYVSQLLDYKERLLKFGVSVNTLEGFAGSEKVHRDKFEVKKLITQRDVQDCKSDQMVVDKHTIITPLARDTARELGKSITVMETKGAEETCKWEQ